ncbi:hypothetical protein NN6n1_13170 [Shinella zoogloeoides]
MADVRRLCEVGFATVAAKELASQIQSGGLQIGTTSTTAMAGNRVPTATIRGGVIQQAAIADLAGGADLATTVTKVNAILAALRAAGVIAT